VKVHTIRVLTSLFPYEIITVSINKSDKKKCCKLGGPVRSTKNSSLEVVVIDGLKRKINIIKR